MKYKYYQNESKFNGVFSRNNLPKIKDEAYDAINLDEYKSPGTNWIALYVNGGNVTYFGSFEVEHSPKEIKKFIGNNFNKYLQNTSTQFNNEQIRLYWIY